MTENTKRNDACPCGSGKKFKQCCMRTPSAGKQTEYEAKKRRAIEKLSKEPAFNEDAVTSAEPKAAQIEAGLAAIAVMLQEKEVGTVIKLVDKYVQDENIRTDFTYLDISERLEVDDRFAIAKRELCCLAGGDPVKLYVKKLGF